MPVNLGTLRETEQSETLFVNDESKKREAAGEKVYKFGFGQSPFLPPTSVINRVKEEAHRKEYMSVQGDVTLRKAIAKFHAEVDGINTNSDFVLVGPGSKMLIYSVMAAFKSADVFLVTPSWVSYEPQAKLAGHPVTRIHTKYKDRWRLTPEALNDACENRKDKDKPLLMVFNYPGNPDGLVYSEEELKALSLIFKRHDMLIISDEIYGLLHHDGNHVSLAKYYPEGTIVTGGLSKWAGAGGWRLGIALVSESLGKGFMDCIVGIASETYSCAASPIQAAAVEAYQYNDTIKEYLFHQRRILKALGHEVYVRLDKAGINVHAPQGAFYLNPDFSSVKEKLAVKGIYNAAQLCERLIEDIGVALLPGHAFGYDSESLVIRLAYVDFDGVKALAASEKLGKDVSIDDTFLQNYCGKVLEGIDLLVGWVG
jgi:aspartate aminotransferase